MDKTEYKIKLDQINSLVEANDYEGALEVVDSIDWRRVKSVRTLCKVADIYEICDMLEDCKKILLLAYKRSSIGKVILYRLVEVSLKMGDVDEAVEYYTEFAQNAPGDHSKYVLKYKIYRAKRSPIEDQIAILEDYKEREFTERWAYELAKLYSKAGMQDKCVELCDDIDLWFSEGTYVTKAMELKMQYEELAPSQQQKYDNRHLYEEPVDPIVEKQEEVAPDAAEEILKKLEDAGAELALGVQQAQLAAQEAAVTREQEVVEEEKLEAEESESEVAESEEPVFHTAPIAPENLKEKLASSLRDVLSGIYKGKEEGIREYVPEEAEEEVVDFGTVKELEPENFEGAAAHTQDLEKVWEASKEEPAEEPVDEFIQKLLEETASDLAHQVSSGEYVEEPKEETVEEPKEEVDEAAIAFEESIIAQIEEPVSEESEEAEEAVVESEVEEAAEAEPVVELSIEEQILAEETAEQRRTRILNDTRPEKFTDEQKKLFTYFAKVPGMDQQILDALNGVYMNASDKTSKRGNIAVMGSEGSGKTRLTDNLVRAISRDLGLEAVKMARISGNAMNEKDPAQIVGKMAGGFLLIEFAGLMTDETIDKLSQALEFRTDSLVLIIEDEKSRMRKLLAEHEAFAKKFGTVISIPVFTNDELVSFARTYADENGYKIDELGVLALYTRIGERQSEDSPMTVALVKEIVDQAISKAHKGKVGRKVAGKRLDPEGNILLFEKDFDF